MQLSRPPQCAARFRACMLAIFQHLHAIYENVLHAYRILMRFLIRGAVGNRRRIEYDHIGKHSLLEEPAMIESQFLAGNPVSRRTASRIGITFSSREYLPSTRAKFP